MKRDMDLIREILVLINDDPKYDGTREFYYQTPDEFGVHNHSVEEVAYHLALLIEAGFVNGAVTIGTPMQIIRKLTWQGHEFEANIRDQDIWSRTKERIKGIPSLALGIIAKVAEAEVMKRVGLS